MTDINSDEPICDYKVESDLISEELDRASGELSSSLVWTVEPTVSVSVHNNDTAASSTCTIIPVSEFISQQKCPVCLRCTSKFECARCLIARSPYINTFPQTRKDLCDTGAKLSEDLCSRLGEEDHSSLWECVSHKTLSLLSLKNVLALKREELVRKKLRLTKIVSFQGKYLKTVDALTSRQPTFEANRRSRGEKVNEKRGRLQRRLTRLKEIENSLVANMFKYLLPLKPACIMNPNEPVKSRHSMTICEGLAEASQTEQKGGRWLLSDSSSDPHPGHCFNVAGCRLLDYSMYKNIRESLSERHGLPSIDACSATSALTHLHMIIFSLYRIFDATWLPFTLNVYNPFSVISRLDLNEFDTSALMLNTNIAVLCIGLGFPLHTGIDINRPACNLYTLHNNINLIKRDSIQIPHQIWLQLRELADGVVWCEPLLIEDEVYVGAEEDWEHVTNSLPQSAPSHSTGWTELLSSATTSIAAIFNN